MFLHFPRFFLLVAHTQCEGSENGIQSERWRASALSLSSYKNLHSNLLLHRDGNSHFTMAMKAGWPAHEEHSACRLHARLLHEFFYFHHGKSQLSGMLWPLLPCPPGWSMPCDLALWLLYQRPQCFSTGCLTRALEVGPAQLKLCLGPCPVLGGGQCPTNRSLLKANN